VIDVFAGKMEVCYFPNSFLRGFWSTCSVVLVVAGCGTWSDFLIFFRRLTIFFLVFFTTGSTTSTGFVGIGGWSTGFVGIGGTGSVTPMVPRSVRIVSSLVSIRVN
jgi:hypothetical protein